MTPGPMLYPMLAHLCWVALLYVLLTLVRTPAVWGLGANERRLAQCASVEPRVSANLSNQFEWPLFFHLAALLGIISGVQDDAVLIGLAWTFIVGRVLHSAVQILTSNIRLRGLVFTINFLAVLGMWFWLARATQSLCASIP